MADKDNKEMLKKVKEMLILAQQLHHGNAELEKLAGDDKDMKAIAKSVVTDFKPYHKALREMLTKAGG